MVLVLTKVTLQFPLHSTLQKSVWQKKSDNLTKMEKNQILYELVKVSVWWLLNGWCEAATIEDNIAMFTIKCHNISF